jgi:hypothetical protein
MYVLSSLPASHQSIASGLFQTVTKLCVTLGFGISTALFDHTAKNPSKTGYHANDPIEPYASTFWFSVAVSSLGLMLCPLLTVGTQGHHDEKKVQSAIETADPARLAGGEECGAENSNSSSNPAEKHTRAVGPADRKEVSAPVSVVESSKDKEKDIEV